MTLLEKFLLSPGLRQYRSIITGDETIVNDAAFRAGLEALVLGGGPELARLRSVEAAAKACVDFYACKGRPKEGCHSDEFMALYDAVYPQPVLTWTEEKNGQGNKTWKATGKCWAFYIFPGVANDKLCWRTNCDGAVYDTPESAKLACEARAKELK